MNKLVSPQHEQGDHDRWLSPQVMWIALAQLLCTSLWFSANSAAQELIRELALSPTDIGWLTNAVQIGFIVGTLFLAAGGLADRFAASRIFLVASLIGAAANAIFAFVELGVQGALFARFIVGLSLAGIYPIGMKLVIGWSRRGSGFTLSLLVGMLVLGTALPHGIRAMGASLPWQDVVGVSSILAVIGGVVVAWVGDGPYLAARPAAARGLRFLSGGFQAFRIKAFRSAAFGYFGHMWELYAFWTLTPFLVQYALPAHSRNEVHAIALSSFAVIAMGALGCWAGGILSRFFASARIAAVALAASGLMCAVFPLLNDTPWPLKMACLLFWGAVVVADSPQFSSISGKVCAPSQVGSALAIQNSIGYVITTIAIAWTASALPRLGVHVSWLLIPGPIIGVLALRRLIWPSAPNQTEKSSTASCA